MPHQRGSASLHKYTGTYLLDGVTRIVHNKVDIPYTAQWMTNNCTGEREEWEGGGRERGKRVKNQATTAQRRANVTPPSTQVGLSSCEVLFALSPEPSVLSN